MMYNLKTGRKYKSKNHDGTYMYFKVMDMTSNHVKIYIYRDDDTVINLASGDIYVPEKERGYLKKERVSKLGDAEYLAMIL